MPERELTITMRLVKAQAERQAQAFHQGEQGRIRQTGKVFSDDFKTRMALSKQFFREEAEGQKRAARAANALFKERAAAARRMFKEQADAQKRAIKEAADAEKRAAKESQALLGTRMALSKQFFKQESEAQAKADEARKAARIKGLKEANEAVRRSIAESQKVERDAIASGQAKIESDRKLARIKREGDEKDSLRKFVSNQGFAQERVTRAAARAADIQQKEAKKTTSVLEKQQEQILSVSAAYTGMRIAAEVGQAIRASMDAVNDSLRNARGHIEGMIQNTESLRDAMRELLALQGKPMSSGATAEELGEFAAIGLAPQQGIAAGKAFRENAQGMIQPGKLAAGQKASSYRMTADQAKALSAFAAKVAASQGMEVEPAEELMSTLISKADVDANGKVDVEAVKGQFARNMGLFRNERGSTALDVRQATEAIQKNAANAADVDRLAIMTAAQAEVQPGKVRVHLDALVRGLDQLKDEQREQLGFKEGMNDEQKLAAATAAIPRIAKQEFAGDERRAARQFFNDQRELDAFMAHLNRGVRGGIYARVAAEQRAGSVAGAEAEHRTFLAGEAGTAGRQQSERAREEALRTAAYRHLTEARRQAAIGLIGGQFGEMPEHFLDAIKTRAGARFGGSGNAFEDETERAALREVNNGLRATAEGREFLRTHGASAVHGPGAITTDSSETDKAQAYNLWRRLQREKAPTVPVGDDMHRHPFNPGLQGSPRFGTARHALLPDLSDAAISADRRRMRGGAGRRRAGGVAPLAMRGRSPYQSNREFRRRAAGAFPIEIGDEHLVPHIRVLERGTRDPRFVPQSPQPAQDSRSAATQHIDANHQYLAERYAATPGGTASMMGGGGVAVAAQQLARAFRAQVPSAMPSKPFVMNR